MRTCERPRNTHTEALCEAVRRNPPPRMIPTQRHSHPHDVNTEHGLPLGGIHERPTPPTSDVHVAYRLFARLKMGERLGVMESMLLTFCLWVTRATAESEIACPLRLTLRKHVRFALMRIFACRHQALTRPYQISLSLPLMLSAQGVFRSVVWPFVVPSLFPGFLGGLRLDILQSGSNRIA